MTIIEWKEQFLLLLVLDTVWMVASAEQKYYMDAVSECQTGKTKDVDYDDTAFVNAYLEQKVDKYTAPILCQLTLRSLDRLKIEFQSLKIRSCGVQLAVYDSRNTDKLLRMFTCRDVQTQEFITSSNYVTFDLTRGRNDDEYNFTIKVTSTATSDTPIDPDLSWPSDTDEPPIWWPPATHNILGSQGHQIDNSDAPGTVRKPGKSMEYSTVLGTSRPTTKGLSSTPRSEPFLTYGEEYAGVGGLAIGVFVAIIVTVVAVIVAVIVIVVYCCCCRRKQPSGQVVETNVQPSAPGQTMAYQPVPIYPPLTSQHSYEMTPPPYSAPGAPPHSNGGPVHEPLHGEPPPAYGPVTPEVDYTAGDEKIKMIDPV